MKLTVQNGFCAKWSARSGSYHKRIVFDGCCDWAWKARTNQPGARESANADERRPRFTDHPNTNPERVPQCGFV